MTEQNKPPKHEASLAGDVIPARFSWMEAASKDWEKIVGKSVRLAMAPDAEVVTGGEGQ